MDPLAEDFTGISPYAYVANNPIILIDPNGEAWKPASFEGSPSGYTWVDEEESYDEDGNLLEGLYHQGIYFSDNGTYDEELDKNLGSSTAIVYLADGTTASYKANTMPSDSDTYATVPEGIFEAGVGDHKGEYPALRIGDVGTSNFDNNQIELGYENPNPEYNDGRTFATGINIHKAGYKNKTGMTSGGSPISAGCMLIDRKHWDSFIGHFNTNQQKNNTVSVSISRSYKSPYSTSILNPSDNTRVVQ